MESASPDISRMTASSCLSNLGTRPTLRFHKIANSLVGGVYFLLRQFQAGNHFRHRHAFFASFDDEECILIPGEVLVKLFEQLVGAK